MEQGSKLSTGEWVELYKHYVDTTEAMSRANTNANQFFIAINTALIGGLVAFGTKKPPSDFHFLIFLLPLAGIAANIAWFYWLKSAKELNKIKYAFIRAIEKDILGISLIRAQENHTDENSRIKFSSITCCLSVFFFAIFLYAAHRILCSWN